MSAIVPLLGNHNARAKIGRLSHLTRSTINLRTFCVICKDYTRGSDMERINYEMHHVDSNLECVKLDTMEGLGCWARAREG